MTDKVLVGLNRKMLEVMRKVERVPKNGENKHFNYRYVTESDMVDYLRPMLAEVGVMVWTSVEEVTITESPGSKMRIARVKLSMTFADADSDQVKTVIFYGEGGDSLDKGIFKATTGAEKYALMKTLLVSTGDDPERDEHMNGHHAAAPAKAAAPSRTEERLAEARAHIAKPASPEEPEGENGADPTQTQAAPARPPAPETAPRTARSHSEGDIIIPRNVYVNKEWPEKSGTSKKGAPWTKFSFAFRDSATKEMFSAATFSTSQADDMRAHIAAKKPVTIDFEKNGEYWNIAPDGSE